MCHASSVVQYLYKLVYRCIINERLKYFFLNLHLSISQFLILLFYFYFYFYLIFTLILIILIILIIFLFLFNFSYSFIFLSSTVLHLTAFFFFFSFFFFFVRRDIPIIPCALIYTHSFRTILHFNPTPNSIPIQSVQYFTFSTFLATAVVVTSTGYILV